MQVIKVSLSSNEFKQCLADEASWNAFDINNPPQGYVEVRFMDGETDRATIEEFAQPEEITDWRAVSEEQRHLDEENKKRIQAMVRGVF